MDICKNIINISINYEMWLVEERFETDLVKMFSMHSLSWNDQWNAVQSLVDHLSNDKKNKDDRYLNLHLLSQFGQVFKTPFNKLVYFRGRDFCIICQAFQPYPAENIWKKYESYPVKGKMHA